MTKTVNHVRNPDFSTGKDFPRHWESNFGPSECEVHRLNPVSDIAPGIVMLPKRPVPVFWRQTLHCKPEAFYRVEALVRCNLVTAGPAAGFVLRVEHDGPAEDGVNSRETSPLYNVPEPLAVRAYFQSPAGCRHVRVLVGVRNAVGNCEVFDVRFIRILEPDEMSHPHAILRPWTHSPPPIESVCICSKALPERLLRKVLDLALGASQVTGATPDQVDFCGDAQAVLFTDSELPSSLKSLQGLYKLAERHLVIVSLPAFANLTRAALAVRRIEQPDDPIHAKVVFANAATRGFTLHDSFPYAWPGRTPTTFVQNQFRKTDEQVAFCKKHKFITLLASNCDKDVTSDRPICLYRESRGGGLYVLDLDPIEAPASTMGEPTLAAHLLLSILRRSPAPAGQFCVPCRTETQLRDMVREAANRWDHFYVHDDDVPSDQVTHQLVTVGREDEMYGLPVAAKPVILLRSGLTAGDSESVYGVWAWLRQLLLQQRHSETYAGPLAARFRLAWVPCPAPWEARDGFSPTDRPPWLPMEIEADESPLAAVIDVCRGATPVVRVTFAEPTPSFHRVASLLLPMATALSAKEFPALRCGAGQDAGSRRPFSWEQVHHDWQVSTDPRAFDENLLRVLRARGGDAIRIELPPYESDWVANSIHQTHLAVTTLEHVIGLLYGVIAVNRTAERVVLDGLGIVPPGETLVVDQRASSATGKSHRFG